MTRTIHTPKNQMPDAIIVDGNTYYRTGYTGTTLPACGFGEGHTSYEYWLDGEDACRVHAITATQFWLD